MTAVASDKPPLLGRVVLGRVVPSNGPAKDALRATEGMEVRFEIKKSGANQRRRSFYWVMLDVAAEALTDKTDSPWDAESLHDTLKMKLRLGTPLKNTKGEEVGFKLKSTSNRAMTEPERARWTDRCANVLSHWLEVEIAELMNETRRRNGDTMEQAA
jgi:translation elongation factor EF-1beta